MKLLTTIALAVFLAAATTAEAATCLQTDQIAGSDSDGKVLILRLRNGQRWQGELKGACSMMKFGGFGWTAGRVCENAQRISVPGMGSACTLGKLSLLPTEKPAR
jgi:hypothetical protein